MYNYILFNFYTAFSPVQSEKGSMSTGTLTPDTQVLRNLTPSSPSKSRSSSPLKSNISPLQTTPKIETQVVSNEKEGQKDSGQGQTESGEALELKPAPSRPQPKPKLATGLRKRVSDRQHIAKEADHSHRKQSTVDTLLPTPAAADTSVETQDADKDDEKENVTETPATREVKLDFDSDASDKFDNKVDTGSVAMSATFELRSEVTEVEFHDLEDVDSCLATSVGTEMLKLDSDRFSPSKASENDFTFVTSLSNTDKSQDLSGLDLDDLERPRSMMSEGNNSSIGLIPEHLLTH